MAYRTRVSGEIRIEPPLIWSEFRNSPFAGAFCLKLHVETETVDTDDGQLMRKTAPALVPVKEDPYWAFHLVQHVQRAIDVFPGHTFTGHLNCEGEDNTDLWRVVIRDGRAVKVEARIVWPTEPVPGADVPADQKEET